MDNFNYVGRDLGILITKIIKHLYEQDLTWNIKKLPAMKKDVYFEILDMLLERSIAEETIKEINDEIDFKLERLDELKGLFMWHNPAERINELLS